MTAFLFDIDGTVVKHGTNTWIEENLAQLKALHAAGHQIIFLTRRGREFGPTSPYNARECDRLLRDLSEQHGIDGQVICNVDSPRVIVNDQGAFSFNCETDKPWGFDLTNVPFDTADPRDRLPAKQTEKYPGVSIVEKSAGWFAWKFLNGHTHYLQHDGTWNRQCTFGWFAHPSEIEKLLDVDAARSRVTAEAP